MEDAKRRFHSNRVTKADIASGKAVCRGGKWFVDEIEVTTCTGRSKALGGKRCPVKPRDGFATCKNHGAGTKKKELSGARNMVSNSGQDAATVLTARHELLSRWDAEIVQRVDKHMDSGPALTDMRIEVAQMRGILESISVSVSQDKKCKFCFYQGIESFVRCETCGKIDTDDNADRAMVHLASINKCIDRLRKAESDTRNLAIVFSEMCAGYSEMVLRVVSKYTQDEEMLNNLQDDLGKMWSNSRYFAAGKLKE